MRRIRLSDKARGLVEVLSSHYIVLLLTMLISFILPLRISVSEYGRWQLFSLIISYAGFFALGFNDGIHINYSGQSYDEKFHIKFRFFRSYIEILSLIGTILSLILILFFKSFLENRVTLFIVASFNIIPVLVNGFFAYVNQGTMRFGIYAKANVYEKILYVLMMAILLIAGVQNAIYYCITYTLARYIVILYNFAKSKELFGKPRSSYQEMKPYIKSNYAVGMSLMLATICNQSIIVPGRLLVENKYGIVAFSCYSFAINTMVLANQVTTALSQVFFPSMKKKQHDNFMELFNTLDKAIGLLAVLLLFSYYLVYLLVELVYPEYSEILKYLYCIYPLFVYSSKSAILIINTYKMDADSKRLLLNNFLGVIINLAFVLIAHYIFGSIYAIATCTLVGYMVWYYICYSFILKKRNIKYSSYQVLDAIIVFIFILINILSGKFFDDYSLLASAIIYLVFIVLGFILFRSYCKNTYKSFIAFMNN